MASVIVYRQENGITAIMRPTEEALRNMTIDEIAAKDVPSGVAYKIIDDSLIPASREDRNSWAF